MSKTKKLFESFQSNLKEDDSFYNELEVTRYRPTGQTEGALANMIIKSKFGELEVNLLNIDGEYRLVTPSMLRTKEEEELINNLVNEYGMQGLIDFAADYHYKQTHMNESPDWMTPVDVDTDKLDKYRKEHPMCEYCGKKLSKEEIDTFGVNSMGFGTCFSCAWDDDKAEIHYGIEESALNERAYKKGDTVYWIGAGNEISTEGKIIDFPDKERMTIKWDDGEVNTYSIGHPDIEHADDYTELESDSSNEKYSYIETLKKELEKVQNSIGNADPNKDISGLEEKRDWLMDKLNDLEEGDSLQDVRKDSIEKGLLSEDYNPLPLKLFMNTWGNYNENGADVDSIGGGWMDIEQVKDFLEKHSNEEPFINDVDGEVPFEINEYSNVEQVLEWLEAYENLSENERDAFAAIMEDQNDDFESTMDILDSGDYIFFAGVDNEEDLGRAWVDMVGGIEGVSNPENYVDEDAYRESWREAAESSVREDNPDIDEDSDEFENLVEEWLNSVVDEQLQLDIDEGRDLSEYFDYEALGNDLYNDGFYFATTGAIQTL